MIPMYIVWDKKAGAPAVDMGQSIILWYSKKDAENSPLMKWSRDGTITDRHFVVKEMYVSQTQTE